LNKQSKKVLVIGGGIAGLTAAWELSQGDMDVELVEKTPFLGGQAIKYGCKATDNECRQCNACSVEKVFKKVVEDPNIKLHLNSEIQSVHKNGFFEVVLNKKKMHDSPQEQGKLRALAKKSPVPGAVLQGYSKNNSPFWAINPEKINLLQEQAADLLAQEGLELGGEDEQETINADAVVVATGFSPFNPVHKPTYGPQLNKNVVSALNLEEAKKRKGSYVRPSDGAVANKVAFIQCVGSRDESLGHLWCSQVCCPYALRMGQLMQEQNPEINLTVFYMDIQNTGKSSPLFYEKCKEDFRFVRNMPVDIFPAEKDNVRIRSLDEQGQPVYEEFELVVLAVGIMPGQDNPRISELMGVALDEDGFILGQGALHKTLTSNEGVFVAGTAEGPKDIANSMAQAGQAANEVMKHLGVTK
jgi:heterodisulfide reductase subunit A